MDFFPENYVVTVTVPLKNGEGITADPTAVSAIVADADGVLITNLGSLTPGTGESMDIEILGAFNVLASAEIRRAQVLVATLTYPEGSVTYRHTYGIERDIALEVMTNSFMTYASAEITAYEIVGATGWIVATESQRKVALINAFNKLTQISMKWHPRDVDGCIIRTEENAIYFDTWGDITLDAFNLFPTHFKKALKRAQFAEANDLLLTSNNALVSKARQGVIREKIGLSEVEYDAAIASANSGRLVGSETMRALAGYIHSSMGTDAIANMKVNRA